MPTVTDVAPRLAGATQYIVREIQGRQCLVPESQADNLEHTYLVKYDPRSGREFYVNVVSKAKTWDLPDLVGTERANSSAQPGDAGEAHSTAASAEGTFGPRSESRPQAPEVVDVEGTVYTLTQDPQNGDAAFYEPRGIPLRVTRLHCWLPQYNVSAGQWRYTNLVSGETLSRLPPLLSMWEAVTGIFERYQVAEFNASPREAMAEWSGREWHLLLDLSIRYGPPPLTSNALQEVVQAYGSQYNPRLVDQMEGLLAEWRVSEAALLEKLVQEYGPRPLTLRDRVHAMYAQYCPAELRCCDARVDGSEADRHALLATLTSQYGEEPVGAVISTEEALLRATVLFLHYDSPRVSTVRKIVEVHRGSESWLLVLLLCQMGPEPRGTVEVESLLERARAMWMDCKPSNACQAARASGEEGLLRHTGISGATVEAPLAEHAGKSDAAVIDAVAEKCGAAPPDDCVVSPDTSVSSTVEVAGHKRPSESQAVGGDAPEAVSCCLFPANGMETEDNPCVTPNTMENEATAPRGEVAAWQKEEHAVAQQPSPSPVQSAHTAAGEETNGLVRDPPAPPCAPGDDEEAMLAVPQSSNGHTNHAPHGLLSTASVPAPPSTAAPHEPVPSANADPTRRLEVAVQRHAESSSTDVPGAGGASGAMAMAVVPVQSSPLQPPQWIIDMAEGHSLVSRGHLREEEMRLMDLEYKRLQGRLEDDERQHTKDFESHRRLMRLENEKRWSEEAERAMEIAQAAAAEAADTVARHQRLREAEIEAIRAQEQEYHRERERTQLQAVEALIPELTATNDSLRAQLEKMEEKLQDAFQSIDAHTKQVEKLQTENSQLVQKYGEVRWQCDLELRGMRIHLDDMRLRAANAKNEFSMELMRVKGHHEVTTLQLTKRLEDEQRRAELEKAEVQQRVDQLLAELRASTEAAGFHEAEAQAQTARAERLEREVTSMTDEMRGLYATLRRKTDTAEKETQCSLTAPDATVGGNGEDRQGVAASTSALSTARLTIASTVGALPDPTAPLVVELEELRAAYAAAQQTIQDVGASRRNAEGEAAELRQVVHAQRKRIHRLEVALERLELRHLAIPNAPVLRSPSEAENCELREQLLQAKKRVSEREAECGLLKREVADLRSLLALYMSKVAAKR